MMPAALQFKAKYQLTHLEALIKDVMLLLAPCTAMIHCCPIHLLHA